LTTERFYDEPRYYDIAFDWDPVREMSFFAAAIDKHARRQVHSVIELGCGTGNMLLALARAGYAVAGLDLSRPMLDYARAKVGASGQPVELFLKDMAEFSLFRRFDAAACFRNTFSYLTSIDRAASHFGQVAHHLEPGGIYVIDLTLVPPGGQPTAPAEEWSASRDQVRVDARWELIGLWDSDSRTTTERLTLRGEERGWQRAWEQEAEVRLYSLQELTDLATADGYFVLAGAYQGFAIDEAIADAETAAGRVLVVLQRTDKATPRAEVPAEAYDDRRGRGRPRGRNGGSGGRDRASGGFRRDARSRQPRAGDEIRRMSPPPAPQAQAEKTSADAAATRKRKPRRRNRGPRKDQTAEPVSQA